MICKVCKKAFTYGNRKDRLPNGCGFVLEDGERIDVCTDCIMSVNPYTQYMINLKNFIDKYVPDKEHITIEF